ncbi:MAG: hypothetical protein HGA66_09740, partial [Holophaga sp.]|nr:hypothetical protein [Holophaga sp.]
MLLPRCFRFLLLAGALAMPAAAQGEPAVQVAFRQGAVVITVPKGTHIKASFTEVTLASKPGAIEVGPLPKADAKDELNDDVYHGTVRIPVTGAGLKGEVALDVQFQACTEGAGGNCFPPTTKTIKVQASEIPAGKAAEAPKAAEPVKAPVAATAPAAPQDSPAAAPAPLPEAAPAPQAPAPQRGFLLALVVVFLAGMGASLTPCVYPMIPITMAIIGAKSQSVSRTGEAGTEKGGGKLKGFSLSLVLVLGMAVTYTVLGVVAARSGATFGAFAQ